MSTVGTRIKALAAAAGLPAGPYELAEALGVSYESLRKWTAGATAPNRKRAESIAAKLKCKPEVFMHGVAAAPPQPMALTAAERAGVLAFREGYPDLPELILHAARDLAKIKDDDARDQIIAEIGRALLLDRRRPAEAQLDDEPMPEPHHDRRTHPVKHRA